MLVKGKLNIYYHKLKVKTDTNTFLKFNFHKDFQEYYKVLSNFNVNLNLWRQVLRAIQLVMVKWERLHWLINSVFAGLD